MSCAASALALVASALDCSASALQIVGNRKSAPDKVDVVVNLVNDLRFFHMIMG